MNTSQPVSSAISGVEFGFLTPEDIKHISVKRITNPTTFDSLLHPVPGGLHDASLGAFMDNPCSTCNLSTFHGCPGHCGHIELPVPVYHLSFLDQCLRLLRAKCVFCHRLRIPRNQVNRFACKLRLIRYGLIQEAEEMDDKVPVGSGKKKKDDDSEDEDSDADGLGSHASKRNAYVKQMIRAAGITKADTQAVSGKTEAIAEARRAVLKDFFSEMSKGSPPKCKNCQGISPFYRKDKALKIFRKAIAAKHGATNSATGKRMESAVAILHRRQMQAEKGRANKVHDDEAVADLDPVSSEDEEMLDADVADGNLIASETMTASGEKSTLSDGTEFMTPSEVRAQLVLLFENDQEIMRLIYSPHSSSKEPPVSADMFFIHQVVVPPNRYRMEDKTGDSISESPKNSLYKNILQVTETMRQIQEEIRGAEREGGLRRRNFGDFQTTWVNLQGAVNSLIDRDANPIQGNAGKANADGIKQHLEKKDGLFRKNMMGKRVNFAARSVISPDPNIETNEIGVPPVFAKKLTYPEPVTNHNFYDLKEAILNGPNKWPGAVAVENEHGQVIALRNKNFEERQALANQLLAPTSSTSAGTRNKKVHRHLNNGDVVIMNRQPTLHKPSMMAHRARVLPGEKTIRMHYANCNTYNADFDGDEMNMHFPQNELARAEAATIADTDHQYVSATAGKPLRGLIQDHISMGVNLSNRDTFFSQEEYQHLLYGAIRPEDNHTISGSIVTVPPAIIKPQPMWTGKQVVTTVLKNIKPQHFPGLNLTSKSQTDASLWSTGSRITSAEENTVIYDGKDGKVGKLFLHDGQTSSEEGEVIFRDGEMLCGILDKSQIGPTGGGFVNAVYETYGHTVAGRLLSVLGRLLTKLLHMRAFSCGVEDLILTKEGDTARLKQLQKASSMGLEIAAKYVSLDAAKLKSNPEDAELRRRLEGVLRDNKQHGLDLLTNSRTAQDISTAVTAACLPDGLIKPFPKNQMQAMTKSGAKGTGVNANQISCNLGQQVLEGRRVPIMVSGKTLPCFKPFDPSVRAGGYVVNRFLTGIRPQEYYFHTMAGREGLIDTAVKTSRSGYLQRCIIKGMEGLKVEYDTSVRDADGSMIQFLYGEDGLDTTKAKYLNDFKFQAENFLSLHQSLNMAEAYSKVQSDDAEEWMKKASKKVKKYGPAAMDPALAVFTPSRFSGSTSEKFYEAKKGYCEKNPDKHIKKNRKDPKGIVVKKNFEAAMNIKYLRSLVEPGEAVGVVAGQSIGEPSTQMTLNTFHLAGHSAKNVTLGIPRLREIVMTASASISTPSMTLYPIAEITEEQGRVFAKSISRLSLSEVLDKVTVTEELCQGVAFAQAKVYRIRLDFYPPEEYCKEYAIKTEDVALSLETKFVPRIHKLIVTELKKKGRETSLANARSDALPDVGESSGTIEQTSARAERAGNEGGDQDDDESDDGDDEGDATYQKQKANREDSPGADDPDEEDEAAINQAVRDGTPEEEDETYGGSPRGSPAPSHHSDSDTETSDEETERRQSANESAAARRERIMKECSDVVDFKFDKRGAHCEVTFEYSASSPKLLMLHLVESAARFATIHVISGIDMCEYAHPDPETNTLKAPEITTQGENLIAMRDYQHIIDPNRLRTNDIAAMLRLYGVEACRASIVTEMHNIFSGHGISVDMRHLNLVADTMTRSGGYTPFNRNGLKSSVSPFMKMSFETTVGFLKDAVLERDWDELRNPSARIVVGRLGGVGTGAFDVFAPVGLGDEEAVGVQGDEDVVMED